MADRSTARFYEDTFARADSTDLGGNWSQSGTLQIINQGVRQDGTGAAATAHAVQAASTAASECDADYYVEARVSCETDSTTARKATALLRFEGTPDSGDGYGVTLEWQTVASAETLTLRIRKCVAGTWSNLASATVTTEANLDSSDSYDAMIQNLGARIFDLEGDVVIQATFNGQGEPRLTYTDKQAPLYKIPGNIGVFLEDNDAGVDGYLVVDSFLLQSLQEEEQTAGPVAVRWSFGDIVKQVRTHARRDSMDTLDDSYFKGIINEALQEFASHMLPAWWWEENLTIRVQANQSEIVLNPNIMLWDGSAYDVTNRKPIPVMRRRDREQYALTPSETTTGPIQRVITQGRSVGGVTFVVSPIPTAAQTLTLRAWRAPALLVNDSQVPDLPEALIPGLIWGAVALYSGRDSDRTRIYFAERQKERWYQSASRLRARFHGIAAPQTARSGFRLGHVLTRLQGG